MKKIDILHIYAGTSGSSGLYINSIYQVLNEKFNQEVLVSYNYPFRYGRKIFYRFSDLSKPNIFHKSNKIRLIIRYLELFYALLYGVFFILHYKPKIINYSFTTQINLEYVFFKWIKKFSKSKLWITAHDVIPFETNYSNFDESIKSRKIFFLLADKIIVHNSNSFNDLHNYYKIDRLKLLKHPFPIMDLQELTNYDSNTQIKDCFSDKKKYFLFVGHLRKEKGIEILLKAWNQINSDESLKNIKLVISGNVSIGFNFDFSKYRNIIIINRFLNDSEYRFIIKHAECVILPYTKGTNSGIPSSVVTLKTKLITSDIEMFKNNELIDKRFLFESEKNDDLVKKIKLILSTTDYNFDLVKFYKKDFKKKVSDVYTSEL